MAAVAPAGWPDGVPPPDVPGGNHAAVDWLLDWGDPTYRLDGFLRSHPRWEQAGLSPDAYPATLEMLRRVGPALVARQRAAGLLAEALQGARWVPRL